MSSIGFIAAKCSGQFFSFLLFKKQNVMKRGSWESWGESGGWGQWDQLHLQPGHTGTTQLSPRMALRKPLTSLSVRVLVCKAAITIGTAPGLL